MASDIGIGGAGQDIIGVHLVQTNTSLGGISLTAGQLLVSLDKAEDVGSGTTVSVEPQDIFALDVSVTGSGTTTASTTRIFEGLDENLDTNNEDIAGISLQE